MRAPSHPAADEGGSGAAVATPQDSTWNFDTWLDSASNMLYKGSEKFEKMCDDLVADINALCANAGLVSEAPVQDGDAPTTDSETGEKNEDSHTVAKAAKPGAENANGKQFLKTLMDMHRSNSAGALSDAIMVSSEMGILSEWDSVEETSSQTGRKFSVFDWKVKERFLLPPSMFASCNRQTRDEENELDIDLSEWEIVSFTTEGSESAVVA
mmetsp:Transcript_5068/g.18437  ORF Transcript_5068/g.18437 Transcript_5068/m.18437 type:complete len:212 (+) Transcript_5068:234-869(+)